MDDAAVTDNNEKYKNDAVSKFLRVQGDRNRALRTDFVRCVQDDRKTVLF